MTSQSREQAIAAYERSGMSHDEAVRAYDARGTDMRDTIIAAYERSGMSHDEAVRAYDERGSKPGTQYGPNVTGYGTSVMAYSGPSRDQRIAEYQRTGMSYEQAVRTYEQNVPVEPLTLEQLARRLNLLEHRFGGSDYVRIQDEFDRNAKRTAENNPTRVVPPDTRNW